MIEETDYRERLAKALMRREAIASVSLDKGDMQTITPKQPKSLKDLCNDSEPKLAMLRWSDIEDLTKRVIKDLESEICLCGCSPKEENAIKILKEVVYGK